MKSLLQELLHNVSSAFAGYVAGGLVALVVLYSLDGLLAGKARAALRYGGVALLTAIFFGAMRQLDDHQRAVDVTKAMLAIVAAACVFYEQHRAGQKRPVAERWKRVVGICLGLAAIVTYFHGFKFGYPRYYHRWDQYHYYLGAKYFHEMGYDRLYQCTAVAQDELGLVAAPPPDLDFVFERRVDMSKEVHHGDKKIRNLGGDNLLMAPTDVLEHPEVCKRHFSPERWAAYKEDVRFFRMSSDKTYWQDMQTDHGYNPPPVWTIAGSFFAGMHPAGRVFDLPIAGKVIWLQVLAMLDVAYLVGAFAALWWAFGWRVFAVAAVFWGCQAAAPFYWTGGALLRQDWFFWLVLSVCLTRKGWFFLAGAAVVYAALLRVFPGLTVIGLACVAGAHLFKHRRLAPRHVRMLAGGALAAAFLVPLSVHVAGPDAYRDFYRHTLQVHDRTPLTNHMGLRVLVSQKLPFDIALLGIGTGEESGRMKYTKDVTGRRADPFELWKKLRNDRYDRLRWVAYGLVALVLAYFAWATRRLKSLWVAQCLAQIFIILMSQLTCYYYAFMILLAPLTRVKRELELPLFGVAALTQGISLFFFHLDDRYWVLTAASLLVCLGTLCLFTPARDRAKVAGLFKRGQTNQGA